MIGSRLWLVQWKEGIRSWLTSSRVVRSEVKNSRFAQSAKYFEGSDWNMAMDSAAKGGHRQLVGVLQGLFGLRPNNPICALRKLPHSGDKFTNLKQQK